MAAADIRAGSSLKPTAPSDSGQPAGYSARWMLARPGPRHDVLNIDAAERLRKLLEQTNLHGRPGGKIRVSALRCRWHEAAAHTVERGFAQSRAGRDERHRSIRAGPADL